MIKMVVSDLDGTLLHTDKKVPGQLGQVVDQLARRGIVFTAASGRSRKSLLRTFPGIPIAMVSDNGGTAFTRDGRLIYTGEFSYERAKEILDLADSVPYMTTVLIGIEDVYIQEGLDEDLVAFVQRLFENTARIVPDIREIFDYDKVVKISIQTGIDGAREEEGKNLINRSTDYFTAMLSGDGWVDVMRHDVSKAESLRALADHYGIRPDEIMIFGDYPNDYQMLLVSPHSYAMKNAHPEIKKICSHITRYTNDEEGVIRELEEIFDLELN